MGDFNPHYFSSICLFLFFPLSVFFPTFIPLPTPCLLSNTQSMWQSLRCMVQFASSLGWEAIPFGSHLMGTPPLFHPRLLCSAGYRALGGGSDCHRRMTVSWPARFLWSRCLRVCPGGCWGMLESAIGGRVLLYLGSFWLMDLSLPLSEQLSEGRQSRSSL